MVSFQRQCQQLTLRLHDTATPVRRYKGRRPDTVCGSELMTLRFRHRRAMASDNDETQQRDARAEGTANENRP
jgi:hypothetical protein